MTEPHWATAVSALLVPTVAILGLYIAYRQSRTAQNRLKLDLFDRRSAVYEAARDAIRVVRSSGTFGPEDEFNYLAKTRAAEWLFSEQVVQYLDNELWPKLVDLHSLNRELEGIGDPEDRKSNVAAQREIKNWLEEQIHVMKRMFAPFLKLSH